MLIFPIQSNKHKIIKKQEMQNPILDKKRKAIQIRVSRPFQYPIHINQINSSTCGRIGFLANLISIS